MGLYWNATTKMIISGLDAQDMDGDGFTEVAASGSADGSVYLFDGTGRAIWRKDVGTYIKAVKIGDADGDGKGDVIAGHADLSVFDKSGNRTMRYRTPYSMGVYEIEMADLTGTGSQVIVFTSYNKESCGRDKAGTVFAFNGVTKKQVLKYTTGTDVPEVLSIADLDGDGIDEIIIGLIHRSAGTNKVCAKKYNQPAKVLAIRSSGELYWQFETDGGVASIATGDITGDGNPEIVVGSYPTLYVLGSDGKVMWENTGDITTYSEGVAICDVDGDGKGEVFAASNELMAFSSTGKLLWSGLTDSRVYSVACADVDDDGTPEVLAGSESMYVFDGDGKQRYRSPPNINYGFVKGVDLEGGGYEEAVTASVKNIFVYRTLDLAKKLRAQDLYQRAMNRPQSERETAISELEIAKGLYSSLGLTDNVADCLNLMGRIKDTSGKFGQEFDDGMKLLNESKDHMDDGEYLESFRKATQARIKFYRPEWELQRDTADGIIARVQDILEASASDNMLLANKSFYEGDYNLSYRFVLNASDIYKQLGDFENAEKADILAKKLEEKIGTEKGDQQQGDTFDISGFLSGFSWINPVHIVMVLIVVIVLVIILGIAYYSYNMYSKSSDKRKKKRRPSLQMDDLHRKTYDKRSGEHIAPKPKEETAPPRTPTLSFEPSEPKEKEFVSRNGFMKRKTTVVAYQKADDEVGLDHKLELETDRVPEKDITFELPPNKGIFKASECRNGKCLHTKRIKKRFEEDKDQDKGDKKQGEEDRFF